MTCADVLAILQVSERPMTVNEILEEMGLEVTVATRRRVRTSLNHLYGMGRVERRGKTLGRRQSWNTLWVAVPGGVRVTHLTVWTCNRCDDTACEIVTEDRDASPDRCPLNLVASWVEGAQ